MMRKIYVKEITAAHDTCMFISVGLLMMSISTSLLQISEHEHDAEWTLYCTFFTAQLLHMLFLVVQGQFVLDAYDDVYNTIYESTWYNSSCKTQALYILALRSSLNPPLLTAGGFITLNLKTFSEIIKSSVSYYTVMQSK
ncbi:PREDICTED: putative odorant receptor 83c [Habropoda laboriosa]|uniref:putative odorant receptor 83c n=1 Tax=Habropoda laboriosa TaxID=597456 RepID=UPI00083DF6E0|nr:PREDICTED: putative odorant receptor 83c [Habropoda laboriosa]